MTAPCEMTACQLLRVLREKRIGAVELTQYYLDRISNWGGSGALNAIAEIDASALNQAKRLEAEGNQELPLWGLPILVKDNIDVRGLHTTAGSVALSDNIAQTDAAIIANLRRGGAIILGKTNMTEFANYTSSEMPNGFSSRGGQVKNAYHPGMDPGGSSTGSAVAVSAGLCAAAIGTDTSFSIIGCATVNGVVGLKPSHGALPLQGILPLSHTLDSPGPLTRDLSDALLLYAGMRGSLPFKIAPTEPKKMKIAVNTWNRDQVSAAQIERYEALFAALRREGTEICEVSHAYVPCQRVIMRCEFMRDLEAYLSRAAARRKTLAEIIAYYEENPAQRMQYGIAHLQSAQRENERMDESDYGDALAKREECRKKMIAELQDYDACVMTGPTNCMHFAGLPSVALKLGMAEDGTPRGIILYGGDETRLFAAAQTIERFCQPVTMPQLTLAACCSANSDNNHATDRSGIVPGDANQRSDGEKERKNDH